VTRGNETARLFVAVIPPARVLDAIAGIERPADAGVRWSPREHWHVTLRFLGTAPVAAAVAAVALLDGAFAPTTVTLGPAVVRLGRTVLCLPAEGLSPLATAVHEATAGIGAPSDPRPFRGHLTIGRLREHAAGEVAGQPCSVSFVADAVHLVRSHLDPRGARHIVLATAVAAPAQDSATPGSASSTSPDAGSRRNDAEFMQ
jgi:2'-5' RNA ligase